MLPLHRDGGVHLSSRSRDFLGIEDPAAREVFVASNKNTVLKQSTVITCMETLCKSLEGDQTVSGYGGVSSCAVVVSAASFPSLPILLLSPGLCWARRTRRC